jgi:hypothetical protein
VVVVVVLAVAVPQDLDLLTKVDQVDLVLLAVLQGLLLVTVKVDVAAMVEMLVAQVQLDLQIEETVVLAEIQTADQHRVDLA